MHKGLRHWQGLIVAFVFAWAGMVCGGTFELNTVKGLWQMNSSLTAAYPATQGALVNSGFTIGAAPHSRYQTDSGNTYLIVNSSQNGSLGLRADETLRMPNHAGSNGGAYTNSWTLVMDVRFPTISNWTALLQDVVGNTADAEIYFNPNRELVFWQATGPSGANPVASSPLNVNTWYRLAFTSTYDAAQNRQILRAYVNGVVTSQSSAGGLYATADGPFALTTSAALFSDNDGETSITHVGSIGFWGRALSSQDIGTLGTWTAAGISWPSMTPAGGAPPLPPLTGKILFGDVVGNYIPPTGAALQALANSAVSTTTSGAVCRVTLPLGTNGGTVTGLPNHRFGGNIDVDIMANGDAVSRQTVTLSYIQPSGGSVYDVDQQSNVVFVRNNITLTTSGASAGVFVLYFPTGMTVLVSPEDKQGRDRVTLSNVSLTPALQPRTTQTFNRVSFTGNSSGGTTVYPCTERVPVRFATIAISWTPSTGQFIFGQTGSPTYHQEKYISDMGTMKSQSGVRAADARASNDCYFLAARTVTGSVILGTRAGGISTAHSLTMSLDPAKFGATSLTYLAHFPLMSVSWAQAGTLSYSSGEINTSTSQLPGAKSSATAYARGIPSADCEGSAVSDIPAASNVYFTPTSRIWRFTQDGGLKAEGTIGTSYNTSTDTVSGSVFPAWSGYRSGGTDYFAHRLTTGVGSGRVLIAGQSVSGAEMPETATAVKSAAMLLSGHSSPSSATVVERPNTTGYSNGLTDYAGVNLRFTAGTFAVTSRIAGVQVPSYNLDSNAKYYLRPSGLSGRHLSSGSTPINFTALGGCSFTLTALNLAYLSGINTDSGVNGSFTIPAPANFGMAFRKILLGPKGQLESASLSLPQPAKTLGYWGLAITPLGLDFPQPKTCPPPDPSVGFVRINASANLAGMTTLPVVGALGFYNGDIVTETKPIVAGGPVAAGYPRISRFEPGGLLNLPGTGGKSWSISCLSGLYLNRYAEAAGDPGLLNAAGLMDVPFFNDMEVHLQMRSAPGSGHPTVHVRKPITSLATTGLYDPDHKSRPGNSLSDYQLTTGDWNPIAYRKWQDSVVFDLPVRFNEGSNTFAGVVPRPGEVYLFNLMRRVKIMTPENVEILLDGQMQAGIPQQYLSQVNVGSLLTGSIIGTGPVQTALSGATASINKLEAVASDQIQSLIRPALTATISSGARFSTTYFNELKISGARGAKLDSLLSSLTTDVSSIFGSGASGLSGTARRELYNRLNEAITGIAAADNVVDNATAFTALANSVSSFLGTGINAPAPDPQRLADLKALFARTLSDLENVRDNLGPQGGLTSQLSLALNKEDGSGNKLLLGVVQQALNDVKVKWATGSEDQLAALYASASAATLANDFTAALTDRLCGSFFAAESHRLTKEWLADVQGRNRQCLDDTLAFATQLVSPTGSSSSTPGLGELSGSLAAASLKGYARIQGDSLQELRLDGKVSLSVPDEMTFDGWFLVKSVDSTTPGGACAAAGGAKTEISLGGSGDLSWAGLGYKVNAAGKVSLNNVGSPIGLAGDLTLKGNIEMSEVSLDEVSLGFGFGANNAYLYGKASGKIYAMDVTAGIFIGRVCQPEIIGKIDADIGSIVNGYASTSVLKLPITGAAVSASGNISLMPLIGIPPSCALDLRVGGGQAYFAFANSSNQVVAGYKTTQRVTGELLCIATVTGQQDSIIEGMGSFGGGKPILESLSGTSRFTVSAKVGYGWLSYDFSRSVGMRVTGPSPMKFSLQY